VHRAAGVLPVQRLVYHAVQAGVDHRGRSARLPYYHISLHICSLRIYFTDFLTFLLYRKNLNFTIRCGQWYNRKKSAGRKKMKYISFAIPCYNSEAYMEKAINSILVGGEDVEIIVVNDGSKDGTRAIAERYQEIYPTIVKALSE